MTPGESGELGQDERPDREPLPGDGALSEPELARLEAISDTLDRVSTRIETVAGRERTTRHMTWWLAGSFALDIVLTIVVTILTISAIGQSSSLHQSQLAACAIGNQTRTEQLQLWEFLFKLTGGAKTPQEQKLLKFVQHTFTPVNCAQVYRQ
jgi:hypothetical protein